MIIIWIIIVAVTLLYVVKIILFQAGFNRLREYRIPQNRQVNEPVSVIVPVRNEKENIEGLLTSLNKQSYPAESIEIIAVNDHSEDGTLQVLKTFQWNNLKVVDLTDSAGKNEALTAGIRQAKHRLIITIDADCRFDKEWLRLMTGYFLENDPEILIGPVSCREGKGILNMMQSLEFLSLIGVTAGAAGLNNPIMGNGANLMFTRDLFFSYRNDSNPVTISGDDVFFILWTKKGYPGKIHFLLSPKASAIIAAQVSIKDFIHQRLRWASKSKYYRDPAMLTTALSVYAYCTFQVLLLPLSFVHRDFLYAALFMFLSKCLADLIFLADVTGKFRQGELLKVFLPAQVIYPFYIFIIGTMGQFIRFRWKGRLSD